MGPGEVGSRPKAYGIPAEWEIGEDRRGGTAKSLESVIKSRQIAKCLNFVHVTGGGNVVAISSFVNFSTVTERILISQGLPLYNKLYI